ncbi:hypothetical protein AB0I55_29115 [Actinocatenispora sera]|uniref:hypothetical protein n=1 Tax=Actinocatenispora sera TaxID=390989 RepID=UPI0034031D4F
MNLPELARQLGITDHAAYVLAGNLVGRHGYDRVIVNASTATITPAAEQAIRDYVAGVATAVMLAD